LCSGKKTSSPDTPSESPSLVEDAGIVAFRPDNRQGGVKKYFQAVSSPRYNGFTLILQGFHTTICARRCPMTKKFLKKQAGG